MTDVSAGGTGRLHNLADHPPAGTGPVPLAKTAGAPTTLAPVVPLHPDTTTPAPALRRVRRVVRAGRAMRAAVTSEQARTAGRAVARHSMYVFGGTRIVARRAWDGRTAARYERMMRGAEAAGQHEAALEWENRARLFKDGRHVRRMELLAAPKRAAKATAYSAALAAGGLAGLGIVLAAATKDPAMVVAPTMVTVEAIRWLLFLGSIVWGPLVFAAPWLGLLALWAVGRRQQTAPDWALPQGPAGNGDGRDVVPDESAITGALRHLGIAPLNKAFKDGWQPRWMSPTTRLGNGWHTRLMLPMGVTVEMIAGKKDVLAHNLLRKPVEVWPTEPTNAPSVLDLWVADQGSLSGKVPPWPLLADGTADYFKGAPVGVSQRGDTITGTLMAANYMVGGIMGSGKSSLVVALLLGAMLDPLVEIEVYVMAYNVDYDPMRPRLRTLVKGDEDEHLEAAVKALRALRDEVTQRGKLLDELGGDEVRLTRAMAERDPRMRPKVVVFDECHELFMHKKYGPEAAELAVKVMKKARKVGITLIWVTVSPTADSIPKDVTRNTSHRVAFAVGDHIANDGLLGTGKHKAGITATSLIPGEHIGTALTVGFTKNPFELIRSYYVRKDATTDQITPIVQRALALRDGITPATEPAAGPDVDELADIAAVLGEERRVRTREVLHRLAERNPAVYREWTFNDLSQVLETADAAPYKSDGVMVVSRAAVLDALAERDQNTPGSDAG